MGSVLRSEVEEWKGEEVGRRDVSTGGAANSPGETGEDMVAPPHVSFIAACI